MTDSPVVELGVQIVEKEKGILASRRVKNGDVGELKEQNSTSLLAR